jgi:hypothetical protein
MAHNQQSRRTKLKGVHSSQKLTTDSTRKSITLHLQHKNPPQQTKLFVEDNSEFEITFLLRPNTHPNESSFGIVPEKMIVAHFLVHKYTSTISANGLPMFQCNKGLHVDLSSICWCCYLQRFVRRASILKVHMRELFSRSFLEGC